MGTSRNSKVLIGNTFKLVVGGMKDDLVNPLTLFIELRKHGTMAIGILRQFVHLLRRYGTHFSKYHQRPLIILCRKMPPQEKRQVGISTKEIDSVCIWHEVG
jgi:hypothetical protein